MILNLAAHQYLNKQNQKLEVQCISTRLKRIDPWKPECRVWHLNEWHRWHFGCQGRYNWSCEIYSFEYQSIFADKMTHPINWSVGPKLEQHRCSVGQCTCNMEHSLANTSRWTNVVSMLVQRLRRWPSIKATSVQRLALANPVTVTRQSDVTFIFYDPLLSIFAAFHPAECYAFSPPPRRVATHAD